MFFTHNLKHSHIAVSLVLIFTTLSLTGCGTLSNGRGWGQDAIWPVDLKRIPRVALNSLIDPQTSVPAAGALVFGLTAYSGAMWPLIPIQGGHLFRAMMASHSDPIWPPLKWG